jgi:hypothetical protein
MSEEEDDDLAADVVGSGKKKRVTVFSRGKIKQLIQTDDNVGKVSKSALLVLGKATEYFLAGMRCALSGSKGVFCCFVLFLTQALLGCRFGCCDCSADKLARTKEDHHE